MEESLNLNGRKWDEGRLKKKYCREKLAFMRKETHQI